MKNKLIVGVLVLALNAQASEVLVEKFTLLSGEQKPQYTLVEAACAMAVIGGLITLNIWLRCHNAGPDITNSPPLTNFPPFHPPSTNAPSAAPGLPAVLDDNGVAYFDVSSAGYLDSTGELFTDGFRTEIQSSPEVTGPYKTIFILQGWKSSSGVLMLLSEAGGAPLRTNYSARPLIGPSVNSFPDFLNTAKEKHRFYRTAR